MKFYQKLSINKYQLTEFDAHITQITLIYKSNMILSLLRKRFDDYETMGEEFKDFKNELLEITLVKKLWQIITLVNKEILMNKLTENEFNWKIGAHFIWIFKIYK